MYMKERFRQADSEEQRREREEDWKYRKRDYEARERVEWEKLCMNLEMLRDSHKWRCKYCDVQMSLWWRHSIRNGYVLWKYCQNRYEYKQLRRFCSRIVARYCFPTAPSPILSFHLKPIVVQCSFTSRYNYSTVILTAAVSRFAANRSAERARTGKETSMTLRRLQSLLACTQYCLPSTKHTAWSFFRLHS